MSEVEEGNYITHYQWLYSQHKVRVQKLCCSQKNHRLVLCMKNLLTLNIFLVKILSSLYRVMAFTTIFFQKCHVFWLCSFSHFSLSPNTLPFPLLRHHRPSPIFFKVWSNERNTRGNILYLSLSFQIWPITLRVISILSIFPLWT